MSEFYLNGLSQNDLKKLFGEVLNIKLGALIEEVKPKKGEVYLTRKEVSDLLKVDLSTVHNWSKKGILKRYQIGGGRVYYKLSDIENSFVELKTKNCA